MQGMDDKTKNVLHWFTEISKVPRCSKNEAGICEWMTGWAKKNSFECKTDKVNNLVIRIPGKNGGEKSQPVVLQGHLDMVCEKTPDSKHDFSKDPIEFVFDGDWMTANKTTLGADNGIAMAIAMAVAMDKNFKHPPLELLFTVDEETGLTGANNLAGDMLKGKILLNLDSEDEGILTIGCAGGMDTRAALDLDWETNKGTDVFAYELKVGGLRGGHSGVDINKKRGSAIKILASVLEELSSVSDFALIDISGGSAHNAIPRDARAVFAVSGAVRDRVENIVQKQQSGLRTELRETEPAVELTLSESSSPGDKILSTDSTNKVIKLLLDFPHGVFSMSEEIDNLVETSNNLATVKIADGTLEILSSQRSSKLERLSEITRKIEDAVVSYGGSVKNGGGYPPWEPDWKSELLKKCKKTYEDRFKKEPVVEVIHAGLECGIIGNKYPGMEMVSLGPTIENPHSPDERIRISDIRKIWDFLEDLLSGL